MRVKSKRDFQLAISESDAGPVKVALDGKSVRQVKVTSGAVSFAVSQGEHAVEITR